MTEQNNLKDIAERFSGVGVVHGFSAMNAGHINATWKVSATGGDFVLQRVNGAIFQQPEQVMHNAMTLSNALHTQTMSFQLPAFCFVGDDIWCWEAGQLWRLYPFISALPYEQAIDDPAQARAAGVAFGQFLRVVADIDPKIMPPTIPHFHDLATRLAALDSAIEADVRDRSAQICAATLDEIVSHRHRLIDLIAATNATVRVVHNDAKLSNLLFATATSTPTVTALIDLDTVMPGLALYDFGDLVRSCTDTEPEDEAPSSLNLTVLRAVTEGYLEGAASVLTADEIYSLRLGPSYITFMLGVRFLTDFLNGDQYFKVEYPDQNLRRAQGQFQRFRSYESSQVFLQKLLDRFLSATT